MNYSLPVFIATLKSEFFPSSLALGVDTCKESDFDKFFIRIDFFDNLFAKAFKGIAANEDFPN